MSLTCVIRAAVSMILACVVVSGALIKYEKEIRMDMFMNFTATYKKKTDTFLFKPSNVHGNTTVPSEQFIEATVTDQYKDTLQFRFYYTGNLLMLDATYTYDPESHGHEANNSVNVTLSQYKLLVKKGTHDSYYCQLPSLLTFKQTDGEKEGNLSLTADLSHTRIQAFGVVNHQFGTGVECASDWSNHIQGNYSIQAVGDNNACVNFTAAFDINIPYKIKTGDKKKPTAESNTHVILPVGQVMNPTNCTNISQVISLSFYKEQFMINITFNKTTEKQYHIYVTEISLQYTMEEVLFPNMSAPKGTKSKVYHRSSKDRLFSYQKGEYFRCLSNKTYDLTDGKNKLTLFTSLFRYSAFNDGKNRPHLDGKNFEQCPEDVKVSNAVPIAVGAALGVLVLIVLIAYLIGRRKTHKGYESV